MKFLLKKQRGFTLIELLVVISIISLLSSVVLASLNSARAKARDAQRKTAMLEVQKALEMYYSDHGEYPAGCDISNNCMYVPLGEDENSYSFNATAQVDYIPGLVSGKYIPKLPLDPKPLYSNGKPLSYSYSSYNYGCAYDGCDFDGTELWDTYKLYNFSAESVTALGSKFYDKDYGPTSSYYSGKVFMICGGKGC
jgi:prepilin-type N-terminal cleavage/methylation domain-containing protein